MSRYPYRPESFDMLDRTIREMAAGSRFLLPLADRIGAIAFARAHLRSLRGCLGRVVIRYYRRDGKKVAIDWFHLGFRS